MSATAAGNSNEDASFSEDIPAGIALPNLMTVGAVDKASTIVERFMIRWKGEPDPAHTKAVDAYFVSAAEHGMNASTFTARVIASTGADAAAAISGAIGALSGPLHGGAPSRVLKMLDEVEEMCASTRNPEVHCVRADGVDHFSVLGRVNGVIAGRLAIAKDIPFFLREDEFTTARRSP